VGTLIVVLVVVVLVVVAGFAVALAVNGKRKAAASLGSGPGLAPNVPREWAGAHSPEARLHRRLVAAANALSALPLGTATEIEQRVAVEQQIRRTDEQLVAAAAIPEPRRTEAVTALEPLVTAVESTVANAATGHLDLEELRRTQAELDSGH
jgi:hypothetical protein